MNRTNRIVQTEASRVKLWHVKYRKTTQHKLQNVCLKALVSTVFAYVIGHLEFKFWMHIEYSTAYTHIGIPNAILNVTNASYMSHLCYSYWFNFPFSKLIMEFRIHSEWQIVLFAECWNPTAQYKQRKHVFICFHCLSSFMYSFPPNLSSNN